MTSYLICPTHWKFPTAEELRWLSERPLVFFASDWFCWPPHLQIQISTLNPQIVADVDPIGSEQLWEAFPTLNKMNRSQVFISALSHEDHPHFLAWAISEIGNRSHQEQELDGAKILGRERQAKTFFRFSQAAGKESDALFKEFLQTPPLPPMRWDDWRWFPMWLKEKGSRPELFEAAQFDWLEWMVAWSHLSKSNSRENSLKLNETLQILTSHARGEMIALWQTEEGQVESKVLTWPEALVIETLQENGERTQAQLLSLLAEMSVESQRKLSNLTRLHSWPEVLACLESIQAIRR